MSGQISVSSRVCSSKSCTEEEPSRPSIVSDSDVKDVGENFAYDEDSEELYTSAGYLVSENVEWVKPVKDSSIRVVYKVNSVFRDDQYETIIDKKCRIVVTYRLKNSERLIDTSRYDLSDTTEAVDVPTIPEHNAIEERLDNAGDKNRPQWSFAESRWISEEDISDKDVDCGHCNKERDAVIRVCTEMGRVFAGKPLLSEQTTNEYCRHCLSVKPDPQEELDYFAGTGKNAGETKVTELGSESGYREIYEDTEEDYSCVISVSPEDNGEFFVTVELVQGGAMMGQLIERETPTIQRDSAQGAARRAADLYESFWSGDKYGDISFERVDSKVLDGS